MLLARSRHAHSFFPLCASTAANVRAAAARHDSTWDFILCRPGNGAGGGKMDVFVFMYRFQSAYCLALAQVSSSPLA
jgi:hypothetical protein